jgi:hypothetical protein
MNIFVENGRKNQAKKIDTYSKIGKVDKVLLVLKPLEGVRSWANLNDRRMLFKRK